LLSTRIIRKCFFKKVLYKSFIVHMYKMSISTMNEQYSLRRVQIPILVLPRRHFILVVHRILNKANITPLQN